MLKSAPESNFSLRYSISFSMLLNSGNPSGYELVAIQNLLGNLSVMNLVNSKAFLNLALEISNFPSRSLGTSPLSANMFSIPMLAYLNHLVLAVIPVPQKVGRPVLNTP
jgi:hypothetical protein